MGFVYALIDKRTGEPRYVGLTRNSLASRLKAHLADRCKRGPKRTAWLREQVEAGTPPRITELANVPNASLELFERFWIAEMRRRGFDLVNGTDGGENSKAYTNEVRSKMSASRRGVPKSPEHRAKLARVLLSVRCSVVSAVHRQKIAEAHRVSTKAKAHRQRLADEKRGIPLSIEHRAKISASMKKHHQSV